MFEVIYSRDGQDWRVYGTFTDSAEARACAAQLRIGDGRLWVRVRKTN